MTNGADLIVARLIAQGVEWISTLCGNGMDPLYEACRRGGIRVVDTHNEQAAAYMADAYARLTRNLGVVAVSSGIAHNNALTGIANAYFDGAPVMLITGASSGFGAGNGVFQELDQEGLARSICKLSESVLRPQDLPSKLDRAVATCLSPRQGPVHLTIPRDVLEAEMEHPRIVPIVANRPGGLTDSDLRGLVEKLEGSKRPLLVAGTRLAASGGGEALLRFSEEWDVPFVVPIWDRGCVEAPHPNFMGVIGAASGQPELISKADMVMLAGADSDYRVGYLEPPALADDARTVRIEDDPAQFSRGRAAELNLIANPAKALSQMASKRRERKGDQWLTECREAWQEFRDPWVSAPGKSDRMTGRDVVDAIEPLLTEDLLFLIDGGNIGQWAHMALGDHYPSSWLTCGASAVVGWGIPGAMAARLSHPDRPVLLLSGDGAFGFTLAELESAARQGLHFVAIVANDSAWGIVVCGQRQWESTVACETCEIRFDKAAEAMGARGIRVSSGPELTEVAGDALGREEVTVIDVPIGIYSPTDARNSAAR